MSVAYLQTGTFSVSLPGTSASTINPVVSCVIPDPDAAGYYISSFGYTRTGGPPIAHVPASTDLDGRNVVDIDGQTATPTEGIPSDFLIGSHPDQFTVRAHVSQTITWRLTSDAPRVAVATSQSQPTCVSMPAGPGEAR